MLKKLIAVSLQEGTLRKIRDSMVEPTLTCGPEKESMEVNSLTTEQDLHETEL